MTVGTQPDGPNVAAVGGGHGLARALGALRRLDVRPTAVVTVADDGGSSGRLRRELGVIPPGDLRMALLTLARHDDLAGALGHRFQAGGLDGHALGNLLLVALAEQSDGDFVAALDRAARLLDCAGRVLPATCDSVQLKASVAGEEVGGQVRVATATGRVERVWLEPERPRACPAAVDALAGADVVVLGPGSLFTSVIATLLVPGLPEALTGGSARVVYVANLLTQPGETSGLTLADHVDALVAHVPGLELDAVVAHDGPVGATGDGAQPLGHSLTHPRVRRVVAADVAARTPDGAVAWGHDPTRLAAALRPLLRPGDVG
jgi:uncharacterized cofD-like protein